MEFREYSYKDTRSRSLAPLEEQITGLNFICKFLSFQAPIYWKLGSCDSQHDLIERASTKGLSPYLVHTHGAASRKQLLHLNIISCFARVVTLPSWLLLYHYFWSATIWSHTQEFTTITLEFTWWFASSLQQQHISYNVLLFILGLYTRHRIVVARTWPPVRSIRKHNTK